MKKIVYSAIDGRSLSYWALLGAFGLLIALGAGSFFYMEHTGHWVTGMDNQVVWGTPHVFAIFLIVAASGALNIASISSVFNRKLYKPMSRLSGILSIALLLGGLAVLVLDLGRPERLIVAMTNYNFKSIFAWNIILYNGFLVLVLAYLVTMMQNGLAGLTKTAGTAAFIWRLALTTGTGSIFGFLVARQGYDAAVMAPMFVIMSFAFGLAIFLLVLLVAYRGSERPLGNVVLFRLKNLLGVFIAAVLYFVLVQHLTNLYATEHHGIEAFILRDGGLYTFLFWAVQIGLGSILPMVLLFHPTLGKDVRMIVAASILTIVGGFAQLYVLLIGGQAFPLVLFPGKEVSSSFYDGVVSAYAPSLPEVLLGLGGIGIAMALVTVAVRVLHILPESLADEVADPHAA
jgi:Ni/Fe-hydrogenase subunit HybB-like protein